MLYLLDANVLIDANRYYYPIDRVPEFWEWLLNLASSGLVRMPLETFEEISEGTDLVADWVKDHAALLVFDEDISRQLLAQVTDQGYAIDLTDDEIENLGRDPFLIAYALADRTNRVVVTTEVSRPSRQRANRHVPDVCDTFDIQHCNTFNLIRCLDFRTR